MDDPDTMPDDPQLAAQAEAERAARLGLAKFSVADWHARLKSYRLAIEDSWKTQRDNLDKLYSRDERADFADREYAIFWANIEVLKEAVYGRTPVPVVAPRFKGGSPLASQAAEVMERCLVTTFEQGDIDGVLRSDRDDLLLYARGTARVRLAQVRLAQVRLAQSKAREAVAFDHFPADDFAHDPAQNWAKVKWVAFRAWLDHEAGLSRFGDIFLEVPKKRREKATAAEDKRQEQAPVWEIWCRESGLVYFLSEDFGDYLDVQPPWLDLASYWPCPRPAYGTTVPNKLKPVPDIRQYKDQIEEINELTARIAALSESLRVKGFYPAGAGEVSEAIETALKSLDNRATLIPVSNFASLGGKSLQESIVWLPVRDVLELVKGLIELRRVLIEDVYQITGISDIVRGETNASETATAQQIKSNWGSLRIRGRQSEMARFARDLARIAAEVIAENYPPEQIAAMAQMPVGPEVIQFLRDDRARGFVIEIETDSTIQPDEDAIKARRVEFVEAIGGLFQRAAPIVMQAPQLGPFMGEVLKFAAQGFRAGRPLEAAIDQLTQMLAQQAQAAMQAQMDPQPDPRAEADRQAAELKLRGIQAQTEASVVKANADVMRTQAKHQADMERIAMQGINPNERGPMQ